MREEKKYQHENNDAKMKPFVSLFFLDIFVMFYFRDLVFVYMCFVINLLKCENRKHCGGGGEELYFCFAFEHII